MKRICLVGERAAGILGRLETDSGAVGGVQLPYYLPDENAVLACYNDLRNIASNYGVNVEVIWLDQPVDVASVLNKIDQDTVFWPLTDGYSPFLGTPFIGILRSFGAHVFGAGPMAAAASQNKFLQYGLFTVLGLDTPRTWLYRGSLTEPPEQAYTYIAKPVSLGNSIGIFDDGIACNWLGVRSAAQRIVGLYGREALIQQYVSGVYCRATFLGAGKVTNKRIGVHVLTSAADAHTASRAFSSFDDYFEEFKRRDLEYNNNLTVCSLEEAVLQGKISATAQSRTILGLARLVDQTDLAGIFSLDIIISGDTPYFIEFNTNPFIRNAAFHAYCQEEHGADVTTALFQTLSEYCRHNV